MWEKWIPRMVILVLINSPAFDGSWSQDQIAWTPIYVDTADRLDLWTISSTGCECPGPGGRSNNCACCVKPGGCLCSFNSNKCAQCGLEDVCQRFCNVSISSRVIATRSALSWVQIKSPELDGSSTCWWRLHSAPGQRIEVQIHRIVSIGRYNNNTLACSGGVLQFSDGEIYSPTKGAIHMCAENSRYSPPVVFFGDQGTATLLVKTDAKTSRATLLAYVSFSSADDPLVGVSSKGGRLRPNSVCDWIYEDCFDHECVLVSPGWPGLFPPHKKCRYILNANLTTDKIAIKFTSLSLPPRPLCSTHHVAIWRRNVSNLQNWGNPWKTLCQTQEESDISLEIDGGSGVIEFRSGPTLLTPYSGFRAIVQFIHTGSLVPPTEASSNAGRSIGTKNQRRPQQTRRTPAPPVFQNNYDDSEEEEEEDSSEEYEPVIYPRAPYDANGGVHQVHCGHTFDGSATRGSIFRLIPRDLTHRHRGVSIHQHPSKFPPTRAFKCQLQFKGKLADVVQLAVFNYRFRGSSCSSYMELYDVAEEEEEVANVTDRLLGKLCGPSGNEVKRFTSSHSRLALVTMLIPYEDTLATEFLDGAFRFHDESIEGTVKPMSSCEVVYYGVTSSSTGSLFGPPNSPLLRLSTFPLVCAYSFLPGGNQTVSLTLTRGGHETASVALPGSKAYCRSFCGSSGCQCDSKYAALKDIDHLLILAGSTTPISCLCGYFPVAKVAHIYLALVFPTKESHYNDNPRCMLPIIYALKQDALPMTFESQNSLTLVYHATQSGSEFSYAATFQFQRKVLCSNFSIGPPSGSKRWREALGPDIGLSFRSSSQVQQYTYFQCVWVVSIPQRYNLTIDFLSEENEKDCNAWNLTLWAGNQQTAKDDYRNVIGSFCPRDARQEVKVPEDMVEAHIRLIGVSLRAPQFDIRWKYTDVLLSGLSETSTSKATQPTQFNPINHLFLLIHLLCLPLSQVYLYFD